MPSITQTLCKVISQNKASSMDGIINSSFFHDLTLNHIATQSPKRTAQISPMINHHKGLSITFFLDPSAADSSSWTTSDGAKRTKLGAANSKSPKSAESYFRTKCKVPFSKSRRNTTTLLES